MCSKTRRRYIGQAHLQARTPAEEAAKAALQAGLTRGENLKLIEPAAQTRNFVVFDPAILEDVARK